MYIKTKPYGPLQPIAYTKCNEKFQRTCGLDYCIQHNFMSSSYSNPFKLDPIVLFKWSRDHGIHEKYLLIQENCYHCCCYNNFSTQTLNFVFITLMKYFRLIWPTFPDHSFLVKVLSREPYWLYSIYHFIGDFLLFFARVSFGRCVKNCIIKSYTFSIWSTFQISFDYKNILYAISIFFHMHTNFHIEKLFSW